PITPPTCVTQEPAATAIRCCCSRRSGHTHSSEAEMRAWVTVWVMMGIMAFTAQPACAGRSSDPVGHFEIETIIDPSDIPEVPLGQPDTIDSDIPGHPLSPEDFEHSETMLFEEPNITMQVDPIELAGKFEGDIIILDPQELKLLTESVNTRPNGRSPNSLDAELDNEIPDDGGAPVFAKQRNAIINLDRRWPAGVIPYVISSSYRQEERATIARAISKYHSHTCIRYVPRTVEKDYIHILKGDGCSSSVGRVGGAQAVSLGLGCMYVGIVMHELMHTSGLWHEQSRQDRDKYITINWDNIQDGMGVNFEKYTWQNIQSLGVDYDPSSIMHYGPYAFAKDRSKPTIIPRMAKEEIGQRRAFSKSDILKLNRLYSCAWTTSADVAPTTTPQPLTTTPPGHCADNNKYCSTWSDLGECEKNPTWMNVNCQQACRQCGKECQDQNTYCNYWKDRGECTKNAEYMGLFCRKSCERCHTGDDMTSVACDDKNRHCDAWSNMGQCRANPNYMMIYCKKACNNCVVQ
ncbi:unnamed protein product, partial [Meganyctiphanes norvegica]